MEAGSASMRNDRAQGARQALPARQGCRHAGADVPAGRKRAADGGGGAHLLRDRSLQGLPAVLVRVAAIDEAELAHRLARAWRLKAPKRLAAMLDAQGE